MEALLAEQHFDPMHNVAGEIIEPGKLKEVAPGIYWIRMALPFQLDHVNLWALEDDGGWTLIDTGLKNDQTLASWEALFATSLSERPIKRIIVTHYHPDHIGLAGWLTQRLNAEMWMTEAEWETATLLYNCSSHDYTDKSMNFYRASGFDNRHMDLVKKRQNPYTQRVSPIPKSFCKIAEGDLIYINGVEWRVIIGKGHSPELICLYSEETRVLISGDQILPKITPNVSLWPMVPEANPLENFLLSIKKFQNLDPCTLVLPSHNWPFRGLHARLIELIKHHDQRIRDVAIACSQPKDATMILKHLFHRELDTHQFFFAIGESLAHLRYLVKMGKMTMEAGPDGIENYKTIKF